MSNKQGTPSYIDGGFIYGPLQSGVDLNPIKATHTPPRMFNAKPGFAYKLEENGRVLYGTADENGVVVFDCEAT